jgi:hypothetical protein
VRGFRLSQTFHQSAGWSATQPVSQLSQQRYTQRINKIHGYDGHLFRGRYKSILIDADSYLLQVMRYIHRNPITAGLTGNLNYTGSSHKAYLSDFKKWNWVSRDKILKMLSRTKALQKIVYRDFVNESNNDDFSAIYKKRKLPAMLGSETFLKVEQGSLSTICKEIGLKKDSSAGSIVDRVKNQILKDKQFRNKVARIKKIINKS